MSLPRAVITNMMVKAKFSICGLKYPARDLLGNRTSTIARSMACTIARRKSCTDEDKQKWLDALGYSPNTKKEEFMCAYCGETATHLDHLYPLISDKEPTGWGTEPGNLVPCCSKCNSKKGNKDWKYFIKSICEDSSKAEERISKIDNMIKTMSPTRIDLDNNPELLEVWKMEYRGVCDSLNNAEKALKNALSKAGY